MIQRIQSVYLLLAAIAASMILMGFSLWTLVDTKIYALDLLSDASMVLKIIPIFFLCSMILSMVTIFMFKKRQLQFVLNRLNILINLFLLGTLLYYVLTLPGEMQISEKGIGIFIPLVVVVLLVLANKAIYKDESLVKSVDRLR